MVERPFIGLSNGHLRERLRVAAQCLHEVGDPHQPYFASEWSGLSRQACFEDLSRECDALMAECDQRGIDWYEDYWGEPRRSPRRPYLRFPRRRPTPTSE